MSARSTPRRSCTRNPSSRTSRPCLLSKGVLAAHPLDDRASEIALARLHAAEARSNPRSHLPRRRSEFAAAHPAGPLRGPEGSESRSARNLGCLPSATCRRLLVVEGGADLLLRLRGGARAAGRRLAQPGLQRLEGGIHLGLLADRGELPVQLVALGDGDRVHGRDLVGLLLDGPGGLVE